MALFNKVKERFRKVTNRAEGEAFDQSPEMKLVTLLLTSFAQDQFYRSANHSFKELIALVEKVDPLFAAKAAIFARKEYGMRSITHVLAANLAVYSAGADWNKRFYEAVIARPDDMLEIMACYYASKGKKLPNAMRKGFAKAFDKFDAYQLGKYRGENKVVKLVDVVNLVHPKPTKKNAKALRELVKGELRAKDTWQMKLTQAGQLATNVTEKKEMKRQAWGALLTSGKLGYFALLRNLRNILQEAPELAPQVFERLINEKAIRRSKVFPFRYVTAIEAIKEISSEGYNKNRLFEALNKALEISLANIPIFEGKTLVVLDDSGSMTSTRLRDMVNKTPLFIGALFAAALYKSNDADLMCFSNDARYVHLNAGDSLQGIQEKLVKDARAAGTNFNAIFQTANKKYDRIIILSDMQGWIGGGAPTKTFKEYRQKYGVNPYIFSFDLTGYGSLQFPDNKVFAVAGFSEKVFDMMRLLESDKQALVNEVKAVEF